MPMINVNNNSRLIPSSGRFLKIEGVKDTTFDCAGIDGPTPWSYIPEIDGRKMWYDRFMLMLGQEPSRRSLRATFIKFMWGDTGIPASRTKPVNVYKSWYDAKDRGRWDERIAAYDAWRKTTADIALDERRDEYLEGDREWGLSLSDKIKEQLSEGIDVLRSVFRETKRVIQERWTEEDIAAAQPGEPKMILVFMRARPGSANAVLAAIRSFVELRRELWGLPPVLQEPVNVVNVTAQAGATTQVAQIAGSTETHEDRVYMRLLREKTAELDAANGRIDVLEAALRDAGMEIPI